MDRPTHVPAGGLMAGAFASGGPLTALRQREGLGELSAGPGTLEPLFVPGRPNIDARKG